MPNGELQPVEWESALIAAAKNLQNAGGKVAAIAGALADVESMVALKDVLETLGSNAASTESKLPKESAGKRSTYIMNTPIAGETFCIPLKRFFCLLLHSLHFDCPIQTLRNPTLFYWLERIPAMRRRC